MDHSIGICVDTFGNMYLAYSSSIRLISSAGMVSRYDVGGTGYLSGIVTDNLGGIYLTEPDANQVYRMSSGG